MGSVHLWTMISCDLAGHDNSSKQDPRTGTDQWIISCIYNVGNSMPETSHLGMTFIPPIKMLILGMVYVMLKSSKRFLALSDLHQGRPFESLRPLPCSSTSTGAPLEFSLWRSKRRTGRPKRIGGDATAILQAAHWCFLKPLKPPIYHHLSVTFQQSHMAYLLEFSHNDGISILKTHWTKWAIANSWNSKRKIRKILFIFHSYSIHIPYNHTPFLRRWNPHFPPAITIQSPIWLG